MIFEEAASADIAALATVMTEAAPEQSFEIIEAATEIVLDENPEIIVDIAEAYLNNVNTNREEMRYADRLADDAEQTLTDIVSMISEKAPEQVDDLAAVLLDTSSDTKHQ